MSIEVGDGDYPDDFGFGLSGLTRVSADADVIAYTPSVLLALTAGQISGTMTVIGSRVRAAAMPVAIAKSAGAPSSRNDASSVSRSALLLPPSLCHPRLAANQAATARCGQSERCVAHAVKLCFERSIHHLSREFRESWMYD
jgi:hypothetical protein